MKFPFNLSLLVCCFAFTLTSTAQESSPQLLVSENTIEQGRYKILFEAVKASQLEDLLDKSGPFTIFAPSDAAFQRFSQDKIEKLMNSEDKSDLKSLLGYHIVAGRLSASKILRALCNGNGKASFTTIQGKKLKAHMEGLNIVLTDPVGNTARIIVADVGQKNGVIHEIDSVILPAQM